MQYIILDTISMPLTSAVSAVDGTVYDRPRFVRPLTRPLGVLAAVYTGVVLASLKQTTKAL